jgi:Protein of unknown function (DUF2817)
VAVDFFSADYFAARGRFREAVARLRWSQAAYPIEAAGPLGEGLSTEVAISSMASCKAALVVSSGLHGVEGIFGSAVQLAALSKHAEHLASSGVRIVFVHALNPYGFAWSRRVNEDNVDLNRNFLLSGEQYAGSPRGYANLDGLLNPRSAPSSLDVFPMQALPILFREGMSSVTQAIAGGQYDYPKGLFFGGQSLASTGRMLAHRIPEWIEGCERVLHLDLHTGLGKWATCQLMADEPISQAGWLGAQSTIGDKHIMRPVSSGSGYRIRGGLGQWVAAEFTNRSYRLLYAEFGTYHPIRVLRGLRAENQAHHWSATNARSTERAKRQLRELFCPASVSWRARTLLQALDLIDRSVLTLTQS